jgi:hypothetical protein
MKCSTNILLISAVFIVSATVQARTSAQAGAQANGQASVRANQTQARASDGASTSSSTQSNQANAGLASGTTFNATLNSPVDSTKSKPGDTVTAHTTESVKSDGTTVLPRGTKLVGHITQSSARAQGEATSTLAMRFDRAILKNGQEVPLNVAIQAIASPQAAASASEASEADVDTMGSMGASVVGSDMAKSRGAVGGLTSTAGSAVGSLTNTAATVGGTGSAALNSTVNSTAGLAGGSPGTVGGLNAAGQFTSNSRGAFGLNGLSLNSVATSNTEDSMISSAGKNVHLDGGTHMLVVTQASASTTPVH